MGRKTRSRGWAIQCPQIVVRHVRSTLEVKLPVYNIGSQQSYYLKKGRRAFGRDRTHKTRYTLPRPLVVLVGVQRNLESPFSLVHYSLQETTNNAKKLLPLACVAILR